MSRGPGHWQRQLLDLIQAGRPVLLRVPDPAEGSALRRAAHALAKAGKLAIVYALDDGNRLSAWAMLPGPEAERIRDKLSVAGVPPGTPGTLTFSLRGMARELRVSVATVRRIHERMDREEREREPRRQWDGER